MYTLTQLNDLVSALGPGGGLTPIDYPNPWDKITGSWNPPPFLPHISRGVYWFVANNVGEIELALRSFPAKPKKGNNYSKNLISRGNYVSESLVYYIGQFNSAKRIENKQYYDLKVVQKGYHWPSCAAYMNSNSAGIGALDPPNGINTLLKILDITAYSQLSDASELERMFFHAHCRKFRNRTFGNWRFAKSTYPKCPIMLAGLDNLATLVF